MDDNSVSNVLKSSIKKKFRKSDDLSVSFDMKDLSEELDDMNDSFEDNNDLNNNESYVEMNSDLEAISRLDPNDDLSTFFYYLDKKYYNSILSENGVKAIWSNRLTKNFASINTSKDSNVIEIHFSRKLLDSCRPTELISVLMGHMNKAFKLVSQKQMKTIERKPIKTRISETEEKPNVSKDVVKDSNDIEEIVRDIEMQSEIDERLETLDPKPNIHKLLKKFDKRYFDEILRKHKVKIYWNLNPMATPGVTYPATDKKPIRIHLSRILLKRKPRRDLVQTVLHEMITTRLLIDGTDSKSVGHNSLYLKLMDDLNRKSRAELRVDQKFVLKWINPLNNK